MALAALVITVAVLQMPSDEPVGGTTPSAGSPSAPVVPSESVEPRELPVTYVGQGHEQPQGASPTGSAQQSKLWFHDGTWWAAMLDGGGAFRIHRLDWPSQAWISTGTLLDERRSANLDVLWDDDHLYVAGAGLEPDANDAARLTRYSYDSDSDRYSLDADFPVVITPAGVDDLTLARDTVGTMWVAYIEAGKLLVNRTTGTDHEWGSAFVPQLPGASAGVGDAALIAYGDRIGATWTNPNEAMLTFAWRQDGDAEDAWSSTTLAATPPATFDDHIHLKAVLGEEGWRVLIAVNTGLETTVDRNPLDPQILLLALEPDGRWDRYLVGRVSDEHSRPIILIDETHDELYVVANAPFRGGSIYFKSSGLDEISFAPGVGSPMVSDLAHPRIRDATSTKGPVSAATGMVVLGYDASTGHYLHGALGLGGDPAPALAELAPAPEPGSGIGLLVHDRFDAAFLDGRIGFGWTSSGGGSPLTVQTDGTAGAAAATATGLGERVRACRDFAQTSGPLTIRVDIAFDAIGESALTVGSVGGADDRSAAVRISRRGNLSYLDGGVEVETSIPVSAGRWYRSTMTLDPVAGTYAWTIANRESGAVLLSVDGLTWTPEPNGARRYCLQTQTGLPSVTLRVDNLLIEG